MTVGAGGVGEVEQAALGHQRPSVDLGEQQSGDRSTEADDDGVRDHGKLGGEDLVDEGP